MKKFYKIIIYSFILVMLSACLGDNKIKITFKGPMTAKDNGEKKDFVITDIKVNGSEFVIVGSDLDSIIDFAIEEGGTTFDLQILSQTSSEMRATTTAPESFVVGREFNFIFTSEAITTSHSVNFSLCNSKLNGKTFSCAIPEGNQALSYNSSDTWAPRIVNGLSYKGVWDTNLEPLPLANAGEYYLVSVAGGVEGPNYQIGDWAVFNGSTFERVNHSNNFTSFKGRTGAVVPEAGDYSLAQIKDVLTPLSPNANQVLKYNGSKWVPTNLTTNLDVVVLPTCGASEVLTSTALGLECISIPTALVTSVNGEVGAVELSTDLVSEGATNKYFREALVLAAPLPVLSFSNSAITTGNTILASLEKLQGQINNKEVAIEEGSAGEYFGHDKKWKAILGSEVSNSPLGNILSLTIQDAINELDTNKQSKDSFTDWSSFGVTATIHPARLRLYPLLDANKVIVTDSNGFLVASETTTAELENLSGLTLDLQEQIDLKQTKLDNDSTLDLFKLRLYNPAGDHYVELSTLTATDLNLVFPSSPGNEDDVLSTTDTGVLSWKSISAAPVTKVNSQTGDVELTTDDISPTVARSYFTAEKVLSAPITTPVASNIEIATSDSIQIALGKLQGQINNKEGVIEVGSSGEYFGDDKNWKPLNGLAVANSPSGTIAATNVQAAINELDSEKVNKDEFSDNVLTTTLASLSLLSEAVIANATDTIISALGKLQAQLISFNEAKLGNTGGTLLLSGTISNVRNPASADEASNKVYVDDRIASAPRVKKLQTPNEYSPTCPIAYVPVPATAYYPGESFCVMKYEANVGSAVVAATIDGGGGTSVVNISRNDARTSCRLNGPNYDLISNRQWQTIARNIADEASNWSDAAVYSGALNQGHSDNAPSSVQVANANDSLACSGTGEVCSDSVWNAQRRTHKLSNGSVIWDFSGNVWEWVLDNSSTSFGIDDYISMMNEKDKTQLHFGNDQFCASPELTPFCGMGKGFLNSAGGAIVRGGGYNSLVDGGVFAANLTHSTTLGSADVGFRCVYNN